MLLKPNKTPKMRILWRQSIEKTPVKFFQVLWKYQFSRKLVQINHGCQLHQFPAKRRKIHIKSFDWNSWDKPKKCISQFFSDFLKFIQNVPVWCRMGLRVCFGSRNIFFMMLDHLEIIFEKLSKTSNSIWKTCFYHVSWILLEIMQFSCQVEN